MPPLAAFGHLGAPGAMLGISQIAR